MISHIKLKKTGDSHGVYIADHMDNDSVVDVIDISGLMLKLGYDPLYIRRIVKSVGSENKIKLGDLIYILLSNGLSKDEIESIIK